MKLPGLEIRDSGFAKTGFAATSQALRPSHQAFDIMLFPIPNPTSRIPPQ